MGSITEALEDAGFEGEEVSSPTRRAFRHNPRKGGAPGSWETVPDRSAIRQINTYQGKYLPPLEELPEHLRSFIEEVRKIEDPVERMEMVHQFTMDNMQYHLNDYRGFLGLRRADQAKNIDKILEENGDCDDYANLNMQLLRYAGIDPSNMAFCGGLVSYTPKGGGDKQTAGHAVLLVEHDGKIYMLDMNLQEPVILDDDLKFKNARISQECAGARGTPCEGQIVRPWTLVSAEAGQPAINYREGSLLLSRLNIKPSPEPVQEDLPVHPALEDSVLCIDPGLPVNGTSL